MSKVSSKKFLNIIGINKSGKIKKIPKIICFRKPISKQNVHSIMKNKQAFGIVSSHNIYRKANSRYCKFWCNCFRSPNKYFGSKPVVNISESDFVDPSTLFMVKKNKIWDFFYFTIGGSLGNEYKGMDLFVDCLPTLCGEYGLRGLVIRYAKTKTNFVLDGRRRSILKKYSKKHLKIYKRKLDQIGVAKLMATSRFGFFPNRSDCSPMLLAESLVRDIPVLVNSKIMGGWKYVNKDTGRFFDLDNISNCLDSLLDGSFNPCESFMEEYGYKNTSTKLAQFGRKHIRVFNKFKAIGFEGSQKTMRAVYE